MKVQRALSLALQATLAPQVCALCDEPCLRADWRPLCRGCDRPPPDSAGRYCLFCASPLPAAEGLCRDLCQDCTKKRTAGFDLARAAGEYRDPLRRLIQDFKSRGLQRLAFPLGGWMADAFLDSALGWHPHVVVPIPLHRRRRRQRGFDQTDLLARAVAHRLGLPLCRALRRNRNTAPQRGLDIDDRRRNVRGAFRCSRSVPSHRRVLLIDDVWTTGATASEAAVALKRADVAETVFLLAAARAPRHFLTRIPTQGGAS